jgi:hypothetical protein
MQLGLKMIKNGQNQKRYLFFLKGNGKTCLFNVLEEKQIKVSTRPSKRKTKKPLTHLRYTKAYNLIFHQLRNPDRRSLKSLKYSII